MKLTSKHFDVIPVKTILAILGQSSLANRRGVRLGQYWGKCINSINLEIFNQNLLTSEGITWHCTFITMTGYVNNTYKNQSMTMIRVISSMGKPTAFNTITIVTRPACGTPAAPMLANVAVILRKKTQQHWDNK